MMGAEMGNSDPVSRLLVLVYGLPLLLILLVQECLLGVYTFQAR